MTDLRVIIDQLRNERAIRGEEALRRLFVQAAARRDQRRMTRRLRIGFALLLAPVILAALTRLATS